MKEFVLSKGDIIILMAIVSAAFLVFAYRMISPTVSDRNGNQELGLSVRIRMPLEEPVILSVEKLSESGERRWDLRGPAGGLTLMYTPEKGFYVWDAACPDHVCVQTGYISKASQSIVCVPNEIIISLTTGARGQEGAPGEGYAIDAIVR